MTSLERHLVVSVIIVLMNFERVEGATGGVAGWTGSGGNNVNRTQMGKSQKLKSLNERQSLFDFVFLSSCRKSMDLD